MYNPSCYLNIEGRRYEYPFGLLSRRVLRSGQSYTVVAARSVSDVLSTHMDLSENGLYVFQLNTPVIKRAHAVDTFSESPSAKAVEAFRLLARADEPQFEVLIKEWYEGHQHKDRGDL